MWMEFILGMILHTVIGWTVCHSAQLLKTKILIEKSEQSLRVWVCIPESVWTNINLILNSLAQRFIIDFFVAPVG